MRCGTERRWNRFPPSLISDCKISPGYRPQLSGTLYLPPGWYILLNGSHVTFVTPGTCSAVLGLKLEFPKSKAASLAMIPFEVALLLSWPNSTNAPTLSLRISSIALLCCSVRPLPEWHQAPKSFHSLLTLRLTNLKLKKFDLILCGNTI